MKDIELKSLKQLREELVKENVHAEEGLPSELFLFSTTLSPVINVDLIITNRKKEILLLWRDDLHNGAGWHIPGGCIRFKETIEQRIQKCAQSELGCCVEFNNELLAVVENIIEFERPIKNQEERAHFISLAYRCELPESFIEKENMKWFKGLPDNLVKTQEAYRAHWNEIGEKLRGTKYA